MIQRLEELLKKTLEEPFARLFPGRLHPLELASALRDRARDTRVRTDSGTFVHNCYIISLSPEDCSRLSDSDVAADTELKKHVEAYARAQGWIIGPYADVRLESSDARGASAFEVTSGFKSCPRTAYLKQESGAVGRPRFEIGESAAVGRSPECDIVIDAPEVSRQHCEIEYHHVTYEITDAGSANGTFVNGEKVQRTILRDRDLVEVGLVQLRFFVE
ncbi:MAG: FhaA domain-containing protein [Armatimonadota bacterium]